MAVRGVLVLLLLSSLRPTLRDVDEGPARYGEYYHGEKDRATAVIDHLSSTFTEHSSIQQKKRNSLGCPALLVPS